MFLGSWRSTLIIAVSIPLSILVFAGSLLSALHETINIMTLGGLALAVGILVDDATVEIENINRNLEAGKEIEQAILDGAAQIATPALVSTLSICIVFVPMFFLSGVARYLFVPMAEAVVFAMLASYLLSRTVVPTMARYLLKEHDDEAVSEEAVEPQSAGAFQLGFERRFEQFRVGYLRFLTLFVDHAGVFLVVFRRRSRLARWLILTPSSARTSSPPSMPASSRSTCARSTGTRIEETAALCDHIDATIRQHIPASEIVNIVDNIGLPYSGLNLSYSTSAPIGPADADIQVQLTAEASSHRGLRRPAARNPGTREYPGVTFYVLPVDIVTQILNFGLSAPIDIQIVGPNLYGNRALAERMLDDVRHTPGAVDARIQQPFDYPNMTVNVDRTRASSIGLTQQNVAQSILVALSGSFQTVAEFLSRSAQRRELQHRHADAAVRAGHHGRACRACRSPARPARSNPPRTTMNGAATATAPGAPRAVQVLGNLATIEPGAELGAVSHYDVQPVLDIFANVNGTDLGTVTRAMDKILEQIRQRAPARNAIHSPRAERDHAQIVLRPDRRAGHVDPAGVPADRGEFPVVARSVSDHFGVARGAGRHRLVSVSHRYASQRAGADRRHHVHGRGHGQLDPGGELCARTARSPGGRRAQGRAECGVCALPAGADDGPGHDHRHGADGVRAWAKAASRMRRWDAP